MERSVRTSGKAVAIRDGKLLAIRLKDEDGDYYILPGGGQKAGERLTETVAREVAEETGLAVTVGDLLFVIEGSQGEKSHRVDLVFRADYEGPVSVTQKPDHQQVGFDWLEIKTLNRAPLYPSKLRRPIMNWVEGKETAVYLGDECVGDPEVTD